jgi:Trp operon repressor
MEHESFLNLILKRDPRLNMISRTRLSRNLIAKETAEIVKNVQEMLTHVPAVSLSNDLWMTRRAEEIFSLDGHTISLVLLKPTHI